MAHPSIKDITVIRNTLCTMKNTWRLIGIMIAACLYFAATQENGATTATDAVQAIQSGLLPLSAQQIVYNLLVSAAHFWHIFLLGGLCLMLHKISVYYLKAQEDELVP